MTFPPTAHLHTWEPYIMDSLICIVVDGRSVPLLHVWEERKGSVSGVLFRLEFTALAAKAFRFVLG